jgi:tetratricopeptide (TPR) repeat protein
VNRLPYSEGVRLYRAENLDKMIGFTNKKLNLGGVAVALLGALLGGCVQPPVAEQRQPPVEMPDAQTPVDKSTGGASPPPAKPEELTAPLLYGVLLGEIAGQRGRLDISGASYLEAARQSNDPRIAERAMKISVYAKQPQLALDAARRWVELAPQNLEARQALAVLALRTGKQQEALQQFEYLLQNNTGNNADTYQALLVLLAREPETDRALNVMAQLVALRPQDPDAHFAYARLAVHAQQWQLAESEVDRALELHPDWTQALILRAQVNLKKGANELAREQLAAAVKRHPEDTELRLAYARLLVDLDDFDAARAEYQALLKAQPDNGQVVYSLALLSLEAGELKDARSLFEKLVKLDYQTAQAYYYLGAIAEEQGNSERAMQWYRKVTEGDHWIEVQIRMARLEAHSGDVMDARERLRKVRLAHPAEAQRLFLVEGEILSQVDLKVEAYALYSDYLASQPDDTEILYARALLAENLDRLGQAEADFRHVLRIDPENTRSLNALGYTLADRTDRYEEALGYVERAYAQSPDDPAIIDSMGWVLYRLGRLQESRDHLQKAYDMTQDAEIAAHLGEVMWAMGDQDEARALWKSARKANPGDPLLEETIRRYLP